LAANQPSRASAKETIHLSLDIALVVHLKKMENPVAAATAAAVEHSLSPLGELHYVNYSLIDIA